MDSDEALKVSLQQIYNDYLNRSMDTNTLRFWVSSIIAEEKTLDDFRSTIIKMEEFKNYVYKKFREMFMERLSIDLTAAIFEEFKRFNGDRPIDVMDVHKFICGLPVFVEMYTKVLKAAFVAAKKDCNEMIIVFYLKRICDANLFDIGTITQWVSSDAHIPEVATISELIATSGPVALSPVTCIDESKIAMFEAAFGRPMYVQEYFKYVHNNKDTDTNWDEVHDIHESNYAKVSEIYQLYTTLKLDEYYYIRTYLYEVDNERFLTGIVDTIIDSHEYERNMKFMIYNKYKEIFSDTLDDSDLKYIFVKVQAIKLNVYENDLIDILHQFKKETNVIVSHIFKIYTKVFERHPDVHEIENTLSMYRTQYEKGYQTLDIQLENSLMTSLEFHDIIKKNIKTIYQEEKHTEILPSIMFSMLQSTVHNIDGNGMDNLDAVIRNLMA